MNPPSGKETVLRVWSILGLNPDFRHFRDIGRFWGFSSYSQKNTKKQNKEKETERTESNPHPIILSPIRGGRL
jgi:hypothetical protein